MVGRPGLSSHYGNRFDSRNIQISVLTRGYDQWRNEETNLLITRGMVGRLSNAPNIGFAYEIQGVVDYLASHGVNALPGRRYPTTPLLGLDWVIRPTQVCIPMQPMEVNSRNLMDGRVSISFSNYTTARGLTPNDEEQEELIVVLIQINYEEDFAMPTEQQLAINTNLDPRQMAPDKEDVLLIHLLTKIAKMPKRKSSGAVGFDLAADKTIFIKPRGCALIPTGLNLEIPWGAYGRIATRSSAAWDLGLDVGVGVIDSDYRGEVQIMTFNHIDKQVTITKGMTIAQIIFEKILLPNVYQVPQLSTTTRGIEGFGSTNTPSSNKTKPKDIKGAIWETLGEPSDDDTSTKQHRLKWVPKEKHVISMFLEEPQSSMRKPQKDLVGTTSPWATVPRSKELYVDTLDEDEELSYI
ncbi:hypothetical protein ZIOFF_038782 [Zingiber officinale]|uniref:dUTP diphosphatase n=1 Tax=Zingiber officinale TaxID=94328 RepID=A0A8J5G3B8_ZINOF|nr:hypothetical protein ZIOFF_038782 [Zingiber officinale]